MVSPVTQVVDFAALGEARAFWADLDVDQLLQAQPKDLAYLQ